METALKVVGKDNPDTVDVPPMHVYALTERPGLEAKVKELVRPLAGKRTREWFASHFYHCLPLTIANQYGFIVVLESDTTITWDGSNERSGLVVEQQGRAEDAVQNVKSHFGHGIVTIDMPWVLRTARGVNLFVGSPPNYFIDGLMWMSGAVETDQLRNDFTFNVKMTRAGTIQLAAGTPIGHFMPIQRWFADKHALEVHPEGETLECERTAMRDFHKVRHGVLRGQVGQLYRRGLDIYGNELPDHQAK